MAKNASVITYAAGAGLAAIALVYVFGPTYLIDESPNGSRRSSHAVGLRNIGNDCFINSDLQALAGLGELRLYLIRETHRRAIDADVYEALVRPSRSADAPSNFGGKELKEWQIRSLQAGSVTAGLKDILDKLNERPISKKAISPRGFVAVLEGAFGQTINRQQQDAQEFLQLLVERLQDEYNAGKRARAYARREQNRRKLAELANGTENDTSPSENEGSGHEGLQLPHEDEEDEEHDFPLEGEREAQSECTTCGFKTTPRKEVFCMLTLSVPQVSHTTLDACFDGLFKTEHIPDYKCDKCRLLHARKLLASDLSKLPPTPSDASGSAEDPRAIMQNALDRLDESIKNDPENPPKDVPLPDSRHAPTSTIARSHKITRFPRVLVVHLSRSIYDRTSQKNMAKVSFPEQLRLGGLRETKHYRLLATVTHKGGHSSGHYQSFRRQVVAVNPYSNPHLASGVYSKTATAATPRRLLRRGVGSTNTPVDSPAVSTPDLLANSHSVSSSGESSVLDEPSPSALSTTAPPSPQVGNSGFSKAASIREKDKSDSSSIRSVAASAISRLSPSKSASNLSNGDVAGTTSAPSQQQQRRPKTIKKKSQKWWRINDEKVREARTSEVLDMEREVYLLFYELEGDEM
ncbi:hypothetical protein jhhlp_006811 [Lomentospora prolificans]|uniref:Ubiquitin carboxyl-terminal hydrolase n=1 Tax=Lomentospora prolificans TaxID=41688 RepID=A0A2N3N2T6_9PEZI|nr:hypothetical protein jhhlp_006811 [Lomentospora prolificans]